MGLRNDTLLRVFVCLLLVPSVFMFALHSRAASAFSKVSPLRGVSRLRMHSGAEKMAPVRVRFAPSPTGSLHVGGARTAIFNWLLARKTGGTFIVRVEDTDVARSTRASEESMLKDLTWLGLNWDEGPEVGGDFGPYRQSERKDIYKQVADQLVEKGLAYPCFDTKEDREEQRAQQQAAGHTQMYRGIWRDADPKLVAEKVAAGEPHTIRFKVPSGKVLWIEDYVRGRVVWEPDTCLGDFIILRSNGMPVYNFCGAVDDALMKITHVIRAEEHLSNTIQQLLIYDALGYQPPRFAHVSLILGEDKQKLSKRHGATSVTQFLDEGFTPAGMLNYLTMLGWNDGTTQEIYEVPELIHKFDLSRIVKAAAVFDNKKLRWVNGQHLRKLPKEELEAMICNHLKRHNILPSNSTTPDVEKEVSEKIYNISHASIETLSDPGQEFEAVLQYHLNVSEEEAQAIIADGFTEVAQGCVEAFEKGTLPSGREDNFAEVWKNWVKEFGKATNRKGKRLFHPIRLALTGRVSGPDVGEQLRLLHLAQVLLPSDTQSRLGTVPLEQRMSKLKATIAALNSPSP